MQDLRKRIAGCAATLSLALFVSCAKTAAPSGNDRHVHVALSDGTRYTGSVIASSPSQLTLMGDDKITHNLDAKQVKSIEYEDSPSQPPPPPAKSTEIDGDRLHDTHFHPRESAIVTRSHRLPAGTGFPVRIEEDIDSGTAAEGQTFAAEVNRDVLDADGAVVIPRGSNAQIVIRSAARGGRFQGTSDLVLDLQSVSVGGRRYRLSTVDLVRHGKDGLGTNKRTAEYTGGGAAIGAIIGAIAGRGQGAAIGAGSGAAAGAAGELLTKGRAIRLPAETLLTFQLDQPLIFTR